MCVIESSLLPGSALWWRFLSGKAKSELVTRRYVVAIQALSIKVLLRWWIRIVTHDAVLVVEVERTVSCYALVDFCCFN